MMITVTRVALRKYGLIANVFRREFQKSFLTNNSQEYFSTVQEIKFLLGTSNQK